MRVWRIFIPIVVIGTLAGWFAERSAGKLSDAAGGIPTARVKRGDVKLNLEMTGALETLETMTLVAPPVGGGTLQIVHLEPSGAVVKPGEVILQFDPSEQEYNEEENRSTLEEAEQEIDQAKAQAAVQDSDDRLALLKARSAVREAELDVQENPILAAIDAKKNLLALAEAKRALAELEQDIKSHASSNQATIAVAQAKYDKAKINRQRAERNIQSMTMRSPIQGVMKVLDNRMAAGDVFFSGMTLPEFRTGDQAQPGTPIADILDMNDMEITAKVNETDRPSVSVGEPVDIHVDALPGKVFQGKVSTISGMAVNSMFSANPTRQFDMVVVLSHPDPTLRPGFSVHMTLLGSDVRNVLFVPRVALFEKNGKPFVYVAHGGKFETHSVTLQYETASLAVIQRLPQGSEVALVSPALQMQTSSGTAAPAKPAVGGATP